MLNPKFIQICKEFLRAFKKELKKCRQRPSTKAVHNLRITVRRILSSLDVILQLQPDTRRSAFDRSLKQLMRASGRLRNIHVQIIWLTKSVPRIGPGLNEFLKVLARRQKRAQQKFLKQARAFNLKSGRKLLKKLKLQPAEAESEPIFVSQGQALLKQQFQELRNFEPQILEPKNIEALHQFRLAFKNYRYTMEIIGPLLSPKITAELIENMHQFQTILGELHDLDVLAYDLERFSKAKKRTKYELSDLKRARRRVIQTRQKNFTNFLPAHQIAMNAFDPDQLWADSNNWELPLAGQIANGDVHQDRG